VTPVIDIPFIKSRTREFGYSLHRRTKREFADSAPSRFDLVLRWRVWTTITTRYGNVPSYHQLRAALSKVVQTRISPIIPFRDPISCTITGSQSSGLFCVSLL
jgi:hypothetical protein